MYRPIIYVIYKTYNAYVLENISLYICMCILMITQFAVKSQIPSASVKL